uniref:Uncharacterized protein n=1 Tax=Globisporangium ultimum (strain ATCC 200006 / CBS 805.95 / DAOM BR144) TaxID=431595 RepID=K3W6H7_GLOUD
MVTPMKNTAKPPPTPLCVKQKRPRRQPLLPNNTESSPAPLQESSPHSQLQDEKKCADNFQINAQAAKLYGFLIRKRFVGSTYTELQLLISLLFRSDCTGSSSSGESSPESVSTCGFTNEFCWRSHCLSFAALVFNGIETTLTSLGADLLRLLMRSLADADICAEMLARLQQFAQRREELRVEESARIGCKLPIETKASAVRDFALPFCEEIDSRLHYRSPTESVMYSNREKIRDGFLNLLRQFQKQQHSLVGIENASVAAAAIDNARKLFGEVAPENRWWFAKFFVMELLQVGSNPFGESDKDLVLKIMEDKLVVKNPDRLRKLHRRFTSQKQSNKAPTSSNGNQGPSGSSTASNHFGSAAPSKPNGGNTTSSWKADRPESRSTGGPAAGTATNGGNTAITTTFENTRQHFAENQQFFFHFLHSCDSYEFSQLVKYQLEFQFQSIWKETINADPRKNFTETVLKLKVVAKFLGYLRFSPQWHNSSSLVQLSKQNPAFKAAEKEAVGTLENTNDTLGLDVKLLLEQSIVESTISKCVPWLCDYLTMLSLDKLSTATTYFKQLLVLLERIYHSSRLDGLGETGLYIGMQIERVFHVLELDIAGFMDAEFRSPSLLPSSKLLLILEEVESSAQSGEDNLPFLYSQVFVQSCVNELEDLRGFIQTRAKPSHRVTKRAAAGGAPLSGASQLTAIRKLRPLQVITEDEHNDTTADATMSSTATSLTDDDRLSESIFKIHPNLKKVVEFVVEVVATNICEHVVQQVAIPSADAFVNSCVKDSGLASPQGSSLSSSSSSATSTELEATTIVFLQLLESRVFRTIQETVVRSLQETTRLCNDHVRASIPPLLPPSCHPTLAQSVLLVALNRTRGVTNNLISKSCRSEFTKRLALRKKAILKETAFKSAAAAANAPARDQEPTSSGDEDDGNVVRTLSSMFDEHAGVEDSREEEIFALKHVSAQIFKLSRSRGGGGEKAPLAMEDWTKVHVSVARHLKTFASRLYALQRADERLEQDSGGSNHDLPVWDATWRVTTSCLRVLTRFGDEVVVAEWMDNERTQAPKTQALEGSVAGFIDAFIALFSVATCLSSKERSAHTETQEDVAVRRIQALVEVVVESLVAKPSQLNLGARACDSAVLERLVLNPRARILAALMTANDAEPAFLTAQRSFTQHEPHDSNATKSLSGAQQFRSEVWKRTTARHS